MNRLRLFLIGLLFAVGCSSSDKTRDADTYYLAAFETFDEDEYPEVLPPLPSTEVDHDYPAALEEPGEARRVRRVRGYRVQVFSSRDKRLADEELQRAIEWWEDHRSGQSSGDPPIYVEYEQPFFKVRIGNYTSRTKANSDASSLSRAFQGAFVVPAIVHQVR